MSFYDFPYCTGSCKRKKVSYQLDKCIPPNTRRLGLRIAVVKKSPYSSRKGKNAFFSLLSKILSTLFSHSSRCFFLITFFHEVLHLPILSAEYCFNKTIGLFSVCMHMKFHIKYLLCSLPSYFLQVILLKLFYFCARDMPCY